MKKITFARYMENAEIDLQLFKQMKQKRAVTITSGGCFALTLVLSEPEIIYAIDKNPHQNDLLELKIAAIESLDYEDYASLMLGTTDNGHTLYRACRDRLSQPARIFWDQNRNRMKKGLLFCGITEKVAFMFGKSISLLMGRKKVNRLFEITDTAELQTFYDSQWNTTFWNLVLRSFTSQALLSRFVDFRHLGFQEFQQHVQYLFKRTFTLMPPKHNYFLSPLLLNRYYDHNSMPLYLLKENFDSLKKNVNKINLVNKGFDEFIDSQDYQNIGFFSLSNIIDWQDIDTYVSIYSKIETICSDDAIITIRNVLNLQALDAALQQTAFNKNTELEAEFQDKEWFFNLSIWKKE